MHWIEGRVGTRAGLEAVDKEKNLISSGNQICYYVKM
jgi:hypothetical protein